MSNRLATWRVEVLGLKPYQTHFYSECRLLDKDCEQCEQYYWEEVHADFCDKSCEHCTEGIGG